MGSVRRVTAVSAVVVAGLLGAVVAVGDVGAQASVSGTAACAPTAVFETDGHTAGESLANWNASRFNANPPAGWEIVRVPYYAGVFPVADRKALDDSVAEGVSRLTRVVVSYHLACPRSRLILAGYSEGAAVAGDVLENLAADTAIPHRLIAGVLYGNPRRPFGADGTGGIETNLPTVLPGVTMRGGQHHGDLAVRNVCNENDGICNSANMITNLPAFANGLDGYANGDHAYDLDPARDQGSGLLLHRQRPRIAYGPPLPVPIGTPWQLQQQLGGAAGRTEAAVARTGLTALLGRPLIERLTATSPWFGILAAA